MMLFMWLCCCVSGNLYPALRKKDYGQRDLYPEFRQQSSTTSTATALTGGAVTASDTVTAVTAPAVAAVPAALTSSSSSSLLLLNSPNCSLIHHPGSELRAEDFQCDSDISTTVDCRKLDLVNWSCEWGVVGVLVYEEIRFNHYLEEVQMLNPQCALKMSYAVADNIFLKRFICPAKSLYTVDIQEGKIKSFMFRINLAIFLRGVGCRVQTETIRSVLEFAIGSGPLVAQLIHKYVLQRK